MNILGFFNGRRTAVIVASFVAAALLSACSGSKTSSVTPAVTTTPPAVATATTASGAPVEQLVAGSYAWVNAMTDHTLYYLSNDTAYGGGCIGACLQKWPPLYANTYAVASGSFTVITRSDGTGKQWAYEGHPLYNFSGDTGPDETNGNGLAYNGGTWYISRPETATSTASPAPTATPYAY